MALPKFSEKVDYSKKPQISCRAYNLHFLGSATIGNSIIIWKITDATAYQLP